MKTSTLAISAFFYSILSLTAICPNGAQAAEVPKYASKPYDATLTGTLPDGKHVTHTICDGKGHIRTETNLKDGKKAVSIADYVNKTVTVLMDAQKMSMTVPLPQKEVDIKDLDSALKASAKSLGTKVINGHPCHGYEKSNNGNVSDLWIGDDIHYLVRSETTTPKGKIIMDLTAYSTKAPAAALFKIPAGYQDMKMPTMGSMASMHTLRDLKNIKGLSNLKEMKDLKNLNYLKSAKDTTEKAQ